MATMEEQINWFKEVLNERPNTFADYFKADISEYIDTNKLNEDQLKSLINHKFESFSQCNSKEMIRDFVSEVTSYIVMKIQVEETIYDYFNS